MKAIIEKRVTAVSLDKDKSGWMYDQSEINRTVTILLLGIPIYRYSFKRDISDK